MIGATRIVHHFNELRAKMKWKGTGLTLLVIQSGSARSNGCSPQELPMRAIVIVLAVCADRGEKVLSERNFRAL